MLLFCSGIAIDEPARKADTAKAANVVFRFMRTNPFGSRFTYTGLTVAWDSEILFSVSQINTGVMRIPLSRLQKSSRCVA